MRQKLARLLSKANLKEEEIRIYLCLLKHTGASAPQLTEETGLNSMMVYRTLKRLQERGLVKETKVNNKQSIYTGLSLKSLIDHVDKKRRKITKLQNSLMDLAPFLPYIDLNEESQDAVEIREGLDAFAEEYLKVPNIAEEEILAVGSMCNYWEVLGWDLDTPEERHFIHMRQSKGIHARVLHLDQDGVDTIVNRDTVEKRTTKVKEELPIMNNSMVITEKDARLFICDKENPRVIIMRQPELLKVYKDQFTNMWDR